MLKVGNVLTKKSKIFNFHRMSIGGTFNTGLSHPFLGMGQGPLELGKIASF